MTRPQLRLPLTGLMGKSSPGTRLKSPLPHGGPTSTAAEVEMAEDLWGVEDLVVLVVVVEAAAVATTAAEVVDTPVVEEGSREPVTGSVQTRLVRT